MDILLESLLPNYNALMAIKNSKGLRSPQIVSEKELALIEARLGLVLPSDLRAVALAFGDIGLAYMPQYIICNVESPQSAASVTLERRAHDGLPDRFICLSENDDDVILLETQSEADKAAPVYWLDISAYSDFLHGEFPGDVYRTFPTYADYYKFLLEKEILVQTGD